MKKQGLRHTATAFVVLGLMAAGPLTGCNDDGGIGAEGTPALDLDTDRFTYPKLAVRDGGDCPEGAICEADRRVLVRNIGAGTLKLAGIKFTGIDADRLADFSLYWNPSADGRDDEYVGYEAGGPSQFPQVVDIPPGESLEFVLSYQPSVSETVRGAVVFESNDTNNRNVELIIDTGDSGPEINVNPRTIDFGRVPAGTEAVETVQIQNIGQAPLTFQQIGIEQIQSDFSVRINDVDPLQDPSVLADPDGDGEPGLAPSAAFEMQVHYLTEVEGQDEGTIIIVTNDERSPTPIELVANGATPCINVQPGSLEFPPSLINRDTPRPVSIESCGGEPLQIKAIYLTDETSEAYSLELNELEQLPANLPAFAQGSPPPSASLNVVFTPVEESAYGGKLVIESNDPIQPVIEIDIVGRGTINECPVAEVAQEHINALPLDIVTLDGSPSIDADGPNGRPVQYRWTVVERPQGSTAQPVETFFNPARPADGGRDDDSTTPTAQFFVDLAGVYRIELQVVDNLDMAAPSEICEQPAAVVEIEAHPNQDLHVQLVWSTPGDPDETDGDGSDVDMHLLHPQGRAWMLAPLDCYYANVQPDWGPAGPSGNPSLDIDDTNGAGPENINLDEPENTNELGGTYRVGIHYYRAEDFLGGGTWGPSEATVRIFLGGVQAGEWVQMLERTDNFWEVASIIWTPEERRVQEINRFYPQVP